MTLPAWHFPRLIAHRGGGTLAPENTLAALRVGRAQGYCAVEFDVKLSADGVAVLMHDPVLGRTAPGSAEVKLIHYDDLAKLDAGAWFADRFAGERIPRFTEVAQWLRRHGMLANVEIKPCPGRDVETGHLVGGLCRDLWLDAAVQPLVSSFSVEALRAARRVAPRLDLGLLVKDFNESHFVALESLHCVALHCHHGALTAAQVATLHDRGFRVMAYTVNDIGRAQRLMEWGVDGLFTDHLDAMRVAFPGAVLPIDWQNQWRE